MPVIEVHVGRIDFGSCNGMIYSYEQIQNGNITVDGTNGMIQSITSIRIQTPDGFVLENVQNENPYGDTGTSPMVLDPIETAKGNSGRVYMRAARLVERMRSGTGEFAHVG